MTLLNAKQDTLIRFLCFDNLISKEKQKLIDLGLVPGERLKVLRDSSCGFITVLLKGGQIAIDQNCASKILVKEVI